MQRCLINPLELTQSEVDGCYRDGGSMCIVCLSVGTGFPSDAVDLKCEHCGYESGVQGMDRVLALGLITVKASA